MVTKNGIELDIKNSKYIVKYENYVFYFSSEFYKNKFETEIENFIEIEKIKLYNKYKINVDLTDYLCLSLYKRIEKRGFYVIYKNTILVDSINNKYKLIIME